MSPFDPSQPSPVAVILPADDTERRRVLTILRWVREITLITVEYRSGRVHIGSFEAPIHRVGDRPTAATAQDAANIVRKVIDSAGATQLCVARPQFAAEAPGYFPLDTSGLQITHWVPGFDAVEDNWAPLGGASLAILPNQWAATEYARRAPHSLTVAVPPAREPVTTTSSDDRVRRPGPLRILVLDGTTASHDELTGLLRPLDSVAEVHALGMSHGSPLTVHHGAVPAAALPSVVSEIDPDVAIDLHEGPAFYDERITRAWQFGLPVVTIDTGAGRAAVECHGGGQAVRLDGALATSVQRVAATTPSPAVWRAQVTVAEDLRTTALVPGLLDRPVLGLISRSAAASAIVRTGLVSAAAERGGHLTVRHASPRDIVTGADTTPYSTILVQRDSVPIEHVAELISVARTRGTRLVVELDDDLVSPRAAQRLVDQGYSPERLERLLSLCAAADHIVVSTEPLRQRVQSITASPVSVFQNRLDPGVWHAPVEPARTERSCTRLLYFGTATHSGDLDLISDLPSALARTLGREVRIDVVGVTDDALPEGFDRLVPDATDYCGFVTWLRRNRLRWSAGLAPLAADDLNQSKSDLKLLEYAALGLPAVASAVGPYQDASSLATLVTGGPEAWHRALTSVLTGPEAEEQVARARAYVDQSRTLNRAAVREWADLTLGSAVIPEDTPAEH